MKNRSKHGMDFMADYEETEGELIKYAVIEEGNESELNASEDEDHVFYDSDFNLWDDDMLFDHYVDLNIELDGSNKGKSVNGVVMICILNIEEKECVHSDDDFDSTYGKDEVSNVQS
ncbi:UNVERIFIED_CONTAM: hypothetical protein Sindi_1381000 [Sesamum indicum]